MLQYQHFPGSSKRTLLLFHGTGGGKEDLVPLAQKIDPDAHLIAFEGDVDEMGMKRFFKRRSPGVFDEEDLKRRTDALAKNIKQLSQELDFSLANATGIGYSNGANILLSLLLRHGGILKSVFLHHPMPPFQALPTSNLHGVHVFVGAGRNDPMTSAEATNRVLNHLEQSGASVYPFWHENGHSLVEREILEAATIYRQVQKL